MARFWQFIATGEVIGNEDFLTLQLGKQEKFMETLKRQTHKLKATNDGSIQFEAAPNGFSGKPIYSEDLPSAKNRSYMTNKVQIFEPKKVEIIEPKAEEPKAVGPVEEVKAAVEETNTIKASDAITASN